LVCLGIWDVGIEIQNLGVMLTSIMISDDSRTTSVLLAQYEENLLWQFPAYCHANRLHGSGLHAFPDV
jgi:hypothetical protein